MVSSVVVTDVVGEWDIPAGISAVQAGGMRVYGAKGVLYVDSAEPESVPVYNVQGMLVRVVAVSAGVNAVSLPEGMYIVNNRKVLVY